MRLIIVHNHFRPGGVRRVIELAAPHLARHLRPRPTEILLVAGELPDRSWLLHFQKSVALVPVLCQTQSSLGYVAEQRRTPRAITERIRRFLERLFENTGSKCVVWAHNQGLGRNLVLTRELQRACNSRGVFLISHHHDWWFDNRWARWPEMRRAGARSIAEVASIILAVSPRTKHVAINLAEAAVLQKHFGAASGWLPNLADKSLPNRRLSHYRVRRWSRKEIRRDAPIWLMPCRLLRRKNIAEALLLTRWLRPEAWLVTTGDVTSAEEQTYADRLSSFSAKYKWPLRLGILAGAEQGRPSVAELIEASETVLLTSLQEGFGLAYLDAAAARRPLIARALPNIIPDLTRFGFRFPYLYKEILIHPSLFDWEAEKKRQKRLFSRWLLNLPAECRRWAGLPSLLQARAHPVPTPFNQMTFAAQLEILKVPVEQSWELCAPLNPSLSKWRNLISKGQLHPTLWPNKADKWLSGAAYSRRFLRILRDSPRELAEADAPIAAQEELIRRKLAPENLYPLSWSAET